MSAKTKKFYTAKYDRVFKTILCDEDNKDLFQEFLSRLLKKKVEIIEFLRNELPVQTTLEKVKTVDVLVKVDGETMLSKKLDIKIISECTGLTEGEIEKLVF